MHAVPGGPFDARPDSRLSPEAVRALENYYGLSEPLPNQFVSMLSGLIRGDLGVSFAQAGQPVSTLLADRLLPSFLLGLMAFAFVVGVGLPLGVMAAVKRRSAWDALNLASSTVLAA